MGFAGKPRVLAAADHSNSRELRYYFSVTLEANPAIEGDTGEVSPEKLRQIIAFVSKNRIALLMHWCGELDALEVLDLILPEEQRW